MTIIRDEAAVTPRYVTGFDPARELPMMLSYIPAVVLKVEDRAPEIRYRSDSEAKD